MNSKPLVAAGVVLLGAAALVPYLAGNYVEHEVRAGLDRYNKGQKLVTVVVESYERSWLRSDLVARVKLQDDDVELARVTTRMRHAPYAGLAFVSGESQVHMPDASAATEQYYFGGQAPVTVAFSVSPGGAVLGDIQSPSVDKPVVQAPKSRFVLAASRGSFGMNADGQYKFEWKMPKIEFTAPDMAFAFDGIALSAFGRLADDDFAAPSGFNASVQSYKAKAPGHASELAKLSLTSSLTPSAETIRIALGLSLGSGSVAAAGSTHAWDSFELRCSLADVPKAAAAKYSAEMNSIWDTEASQGQRTLLAMNAASELATALAQAEPTFAVDKLDLRAPGGNVAATLRLRLDKSLAQLAALGLVKDGETLEFELLARNGAFTVNGVIANQLALR